MTDWPHQLRGVEGVRTAIQAGERRVCLTAPTGGGKTRIQERIIQWGQPTLLLTNRAMLFEQHCRSLERAEIDFGMQASGWEESIFANVQVAMIQTLYKRWKEKGAGYLPDVELVLFDEPHSETGQRAQELVDYYVGQGVPVVGLTATPVGIGHMFTHLVVAGVTSELRACGALVPADIYAPDEPDHKAFKNRQVKGLLQFEDGVKEVMLHRMFGRAIEHFRRLNPDRLPSILFAPGVEESKWFAEQFCAAGIPWSHIDGVKIILNGEAMAASRENRQRLRQASESGETVGVSNRFVLREGIDWPHLRHCIVACTYGSLTGYLQSLGRLLRAAPGKDRAVIQDHGGSYWRHDSVNCDREWSLTDTDASLAQQHDEIYRTKKAVEPTVCPQCSRVRRGGVSCPSCGYTYSGRKRMVIQTDGTLKPMYGDIYRPRKVCTDPEGIKQWKRCYYRAKHARMTFNQARALFQRENDWQVPGPDYPLLPTLESDWGQKVADVPYERLTKQRDIAPC